jgi:flagellar M-ring protein FliF
MADREKSFINQFFQIWTAIPLGRKISFGVTLIIVIGGFAVLLYWANRPDYQVLFSKLDSADAGRISEKLREKRVPFQLRDGGSTITVPDDQVYQLRLDLASEGIPRGQHVGFEVFDDMPFGTTEFVQKLKYQQALQGELARTIMEFDAVAQARVHLVQSDDSLFAEPEKPSTASVVLRLHPGGILDRRQLQGIINLVARAVEGLKPENITVVDMAGGLLSKGQDVESTGILSQSQFEYRQKLEKSLEKRIQTMLEPIVGTDKAIARVSAEVDFGKVNILEETFDPDSAVVRSEERLRETSRKGGGLPSGSPDLQTQLYGPETGSRSAEKDYEKENSVVNYEINKMNRQVTNAIGNVKRLSAAVIIDGPYELSAGADGEEVKTFIPRDRKAMKRFEDIIKKAIGFDLERGDQVNVSNIPFAIQEDNALPEGGGTPWMTYLKKLSRPFFNIVLIALFFFLGVKPFRKWLDRTVEYLDTKSLQSGGDIPKLSSQSKEGLEGTDGSRRLGEITKSDPAAAAEVIRSWISEVQ